MPLVRDRAYKKSVQTVSSKPTLGGRLKKKRAKGASDVRLRVQKICPKMVSSKSMLAGR